MVKETREQAIARWNGENQERMAKAVNESKGVHPKIVQAFKDAQPGDLVYLPDPDKEDIGKFSKEKFWLHREKGLGELTTKSHPFDIRNNRNRKFPKIKRF
jgi:hypothetical protein